VDDENCSDNNNDFDFADSAFFCWGRRVGSWGRSCRALVNALPFGKRQGLARTIGPARCNENGAIMKLLEFLGYAMLVLAVGVPAVALVNEIRQRRGG